MKEAGNEGQVGGVAAEGLLSERDVLNPDLAKVIAARALALPRRRREELLAGLDTTAREHEGKLTHKRREGKVPSRSFRLSESANSEMHDIADKLGIENTTHITEAGIHVLARLLGVR